MKNSLHIILILAFLSVFTGSFAFAYDDDEDTIELTDEEKEQEKYEDDRRDAVFDVKYSSIESAGIYSSASDGSLGRDLWDNVQRSYLIALISELPLNSRAKTMRELSKKALLTSVNARLINNDIKPEPGHDFLTVRLEKLLDSGFYAEAFDLYSQLNDEPYHENLARAGVLAMLYNGEKSLACLEGNTVQDRFEGVTFWQEFLAYCDHFLSEKPDKKSIKTLKASDKKILKVIAADKKYSFTYDPKKFETLSRLEQAILVSENNLKLSKLKKINIQDIPPRHIALLLAHEKLSEKHRLLLSIRAVDQQIIKPEKLKELYDLFTAPAAGEDESEDKALESLKNWEKLPYLYQKAGNAAKGEEQWAVMREIFTLEDQYGTAALLPFAKTMQGLKPKSPSLEEIERAMRIIHYADLSIPSHWMKTLEGLDKEDESPASERYNRLYLAAFLAKPNYKRTSDEREKLETLMSRGKRRHTVFLKNIIENLDKDGKDVNNASKAYEKDFDLTSNEDYVMPSVHVWDRITLVSQNRIIGETILLCTFMLQDAPLQDIYPGVLRDVLKSLNIVGLTNVSRKMAIEALLEK